MQQKALEIYQVDLPDGEIFETEAPAGTSYATIQALAKDWYAKKGTADIRAKQAEIGKPKPSKGVLGSIGEFGSELWDLTKGAASGIKDLADDVVFPSANRRAGKPSVVGQMLSSIPEQVGAGAKQAVGGLSKAVTSGAMALNPNLGSDENGNPPDRYDSAVGAAEGLLEGATGTVGMIPLIGPPVQHMLETSKTSLPKAAAELVFLAAPEIPGLVKKAKTAAFGAVTTKTIPPHPRVSAQASLDEIMHEISNFQGTPEETANFIRQATRTHVGRTAQPAVQMIQEAEAAAAAAAKPVRQQTVVTANIDTGPLLDLSVTETRTIPVTRKTTQSNTQTAPAPRGKTKVVQSETVTSKRNDPVSSDPIKRVIAPKSGAVGRVSSKTTVSPKPQPISDNIADASAGLADEIGRPGPPSSAATDNPKFTMETDPLTGKKVPEPITGAGPLKESVEQTLKRIGDTDNLEKYQTGQRILEDIQKNEQLRIIQEALDKNPDTAYRVLMLENTPLQLRRIEELVGPDTFRGMNSQLFQDFLRETWIKDGVEATTKGVRAGGKSMWEAWHKGEIGKTLARTLDKNTVTKFEDLMRSARNADIPLNEITTSIGKQLSRPFIRRFVATTLSGGTGYITSMSIPTMIGVELGTEAVIALTARLMTRPEGMTSIREFVRAVGKHDFKRVAFYGQRIGDQVERELKRNYGPSEPKAQEKKTSTIPAPPPG